MWSLPGLFNDLAKKVRNILVAGNPKYKETDSINSEVSSFVGNPVFQDVRVECYG